MNQYILLATSATSEGITALLNKFYYSSGVYFDELGNVYGKDGSIKKNVRVIKKGKRYRFEHHESI